MAVGDVFVSRHLFRFNQPLDEARWIVSRLSPLAVA